MKKPTIDFDIERYHKLDYQIRDIIKKYLNREVTFGIVLNYLKHNKIIRIRLKQQNKKKLKELK